MSKHDHDPEVQFIVGNERYNAINEVTESIGPKADFGDDVYLDDRPSKINISLWKRA
jgi:hypothetical protein